MNNSRNISLNYPSWPYLPTGYRTHMYLYRHWLCLQLYFALAERVFSSPFHPFLLHGVFIVQGFLLTLTETKQTFLSLICFGVLTPFKIISQPQMKYTFFHFTRRNKNIHSKNLNSLYLLA